MDDLPVRTGIYALILELSESRKLEIGRLGAFNFPAGFYVYLGSARGPGGLRGRLRRHLRGDGKCHWHIDYLAALAVVRGYVVLEFGMEKAGFELTECAWSQALFATPNAAIPAPRFGASDCKSGCPAHLVHFPDIRFLDLLPTVLNPVGDADDFMKVYPLRFGS
jgi:Uri superfamily endonuclease